MANNCFTKPILLLFFNRPSTFSKVFSVVEKIRPSVLYLYQDGPRDPSDQAGIDACREIVSRITWKCVIHRFFQNKNFGVDPSEYIAIKWVFSQEKQCIILEDDIVPSISFFSFCAHLLDKFEDDTKINQICGFQNFDVIPSSINFDYVFTHGGSIWGWATWKRVVDTWDPQYQWLQSPSSIKKVRASMPENYRDVMNVARFRQKNRIAGFETINGVQTILDDRINIVATKSLIQNVGFNGGVHSSTDDLRLLTKKQRFIYQIQAHDYSFPLKEPPLYFSDRYYEKEIQKRIPFFTNRIKRLFLLILYHRYDLIFRARRKTASKH